jgi:hypothetical protein
MLAGVPYLDTLFAFDLVRVKIFFRLVFFNFNSLINFLKSVSSSSVQGSDLFERSTSFGSLLT